MNAFEAAFAGYLGVALVFWLLFGLIGGLIANTKNRFWLGFLMTMVFSLIGLIIVMLMPPGKPAAPPWDDELEF